MGKKRKFRVVNLGDIRLLYSPTILYHIQKHNVKLSEIISALTGKTYRKRLKKNDWMYIGKTEAGRFLTIFLEQLGAGDFRLKTARDSTSVEKRIYKKLSK